MRQNEVVGHQLDVLENYYGQLLAQRIPHKANEIIFFKQRRSEVIRCNGDLNALSAETRSILDGKSASGTKTIKVYGGYSQNEYTELVTKEFRYR